MVATSADPLLEGFTATPESGVAEFEEIGQMFEIGALFAALGIGVLGFVLGTLATLLLWMKSEDSDLERGYIEIAGNCYQLQPIQDPTTESPSSDATRIFGRKSPRPRICWERRH